MQIWLHFRQRTHIRRQVKRFGAASVESERVIDGILTKKRDAFILDGISLCQQHAIRAALHNILRLRLLRRVVNLRRPQRQPDQQHARKQHAE